jgi:hypothetical protein
MSDNNILPYKPTFDTFRYVLNARDVQCDGEYEYLIGLRHHTTYEYLIDHIMNCIFAHYDTKIYISISVPIKVYNNIPNELQNILDETEYIKFIEPHDQLYNTFNSYRNISEHIRQFDSTKSYKYFIYHSSSERYACDFYDSINVEYERRDIENYDMTKDDITDVCNKDWKGWSWKPAFLKDDKIIDFFINNKIKPKRGQTNGLILPSYMTDDYMRIMNLIGDDKQYTSKNMAEILPTSYIFSYWRIVNRDKSVRCDENVYYTTNCFWRTYNHKQHNLKTIKKDLANGTNDYVCVKRCDGKNNVILQYIHDTFMTDKLKEIMNNNQ